MDQPLMQMLSNGITHQKPASADPWWQSWVETLPAEALQQTAWSAREHLTKTTGYSPPHLSDNPQNWFHELQEVAPGERKPAVVLPTSPHLTEHPHTFSQHMHTLPLERGTAQREIRLHQITNPSRCPKAITPVGNMQSPWAHLKQENSGYLTHNLPCEVQ